MIGKFWELLAEQTDAPRLLECGTRRQGDRTVSVRAEFLRHFPGGVHVGTDAEAGEDVDLVADLHDLEAVPPCDAVLCCFVLEHVRRPWVVARQLAGATRPGGPCYVATHQSFPLHHYPGDYFRFSADALRVLFCPEAGWDVIEAGHEFPCRVVPLENAFTHARDWNFTAEAYLNSWVLCRRLP